MSLRPRYYSAKYVCIRPNLSVCVSTYTTRVAIELLIFVFSYVAEHYSSLVTEQDWIKQPKQDYLMCYGVQGITVTRK